MDRTDPMPEESSRGTSVTIADLVTAMQQLVSQTSAGGSERQTGSSGPHLKGDTIPLFDPEDRTTDAEKWCHKVDEMRKVFGWSEGATIYFAIRKLGGLADTWYRGLQSVDIKSWDEWKGRILTAFPPQRDFAEKLEVMLHRKKRFSESYTRYYYEKWALVNACKFEGAEAVSCIIQGIEDRMVKNTARAGKYITPEGLFAYLGTLTDTAGGSGMGLRYPQKKWGKKPRMQDPKQPKAAEKTVAGDGNCFQCKQPGHRAAQCPQLKEIVCHACNHKGHYANRCPNVVRVVGLPNQRRES